MIRPVIVSLLLAVPTLAIAEPQERPRGTYIRVPRAERPEGQRVMFAAGGTTTIFMNRDGGQYEGGWSDDSTTNQSSIIGGYTVNLPAYPYGDGSWDQLMNCMRDLYAPFNVLVTDVDPGTDPHLEVVASGHPNDIGMSQGIGGVAPMACEPIENAIVYAFPETYGDDPQGICEAAGQESAHAFGLDHEYLCEDIMTYLYGCGPKSFQDQVVACGEYGERGCACGGNTQNSYQYLLDVLGPAEDIDAPPVVSITRPSNGADVPAGFAVEADVSDDGTIDRVELYVDGDLVDTDDAAPWSFTAPGDLGPGPHEVEVRAIDDAAGQGADSVTVDVTSQPDPDPDPTDPDPTDPDPTDPRDLGDFGDSCEGGSMCASRACVTGDDGDGYCTESCEGDSCPYGFACTDTEQGSFCLLEEGASLPGDPGGDGRPGLTAACSAGGPGASGGWILVCLTLLGFALWRRR